MNSPDAIGTARLVDADKAPRLLDETGSGSDRSQFIGGSDVAAILGLSHWSTPLTLWEKKTGRFVEPPDASKRKLFERGKRWEQPAFEMLVDILRDRGHEVVEVAASRRYQDGEYPFLACEIDREIILDGEFCNVEIKTVHPFAAKDWGDFEDEDGNLTDQVPTYYATQAQHGLGITGIGRCVVGCLIGADNMLPYFVDRDEALIADIRAACVKFWFENIVADRQPDPINMSDMKRVMYALKGRPVELDEETLGLLRRLAATRKQAKALEDLKDEISFRVGDFVRRAWQLNEIETAAEGALLTYQGVEVGTWNKESKQTVDEKKLAALYPEARAKCNKVSSYRVLRTKKTL